MQFRSKDATAKVCPRKVLRALVLDYNFGCARQLRCCLVTDVSRPELLDVRTGGAFQVGWNYGAGFHFRLLTGSAAHFQSYREDDFDQSARAQREMMCHSIALSDPDVART